MKKYHLFLTTSILLLFTACNSTNALNHFKNDPSSANAIQHTKKMDLIYNKEINSMVFLTYLNRINKAYSSEKLDSFVVGVHLVNKNEHDFIKNNYSISLNNKKPISVSQLDKNSELISSIPLRNSWANYYLVQFENDESLSMNILFSHAIFGQVQTSFQK